jgi:hypothetical protein
VTGIGNEQVDGLPALWNQDVGPDAASCIGLLQEEPRTGSTHDAKAGAAGLQARSHRGRGS